MGSQETEGSSPPVWAAAIDELTKGHEFAGRLAALLLADPLKNCLSEPSTVKLLLEQIMDTFSRSITVLESGRNQDSLSPDATSKGPGEKRKIQRTRKATKRNRGHPYSRTRITSATTEDGNTWRKYGQKEIFSAKHPRSYYRCTHKYDQGCMATRQVQKSEDDPSLYVITYFDEHTCKASAKDTPTCRETCFISFESNAASGIKSEIPFPSFLSDKQESEEEVLSNLTTSDSPSDYFLSPEVELQKASMKGLEADRSDSSSGLHSSITSYDLEFMDLEDILSFDHNGLFE